MASHATRSEKLGYLQDTIDSTVRFPSKPRGAFSWIDASYSNKLVVFRTPYRKQICLK